jgi:hypothetical protein
MSSERGRFDERLICAQVASQFTDGATVTTTKTTVVTRSSPAPSSFRIFYTNSTTDETFFAYAAPASSGNGMGIKFSTQADAWKLDAQDRLVDTNDKNFFITEQSGNVEPFVLLAKTAPTAETPTCSTCGGSLVCNTPGSTGNTFGLCFGFLALGKPSSFGANSGCTPITPKIEA